MEAFKYKDPIRDRRPEPPPAPACKPLAASHTHTLPRAKATYVLGVEVGDGVLLGSIALSSDERDGAQPEGNHRGGGNQLLRQGGAGRGDAARAGEGQARQPHHAEDRVMAPETAAQTLTCAVRAWPSRARSAVCGSVVRDASDTAVHRDDTRV